MALFTGKIDGAALGKDIVETFAIVNAQEVRVILFENGLVEINKDDSKQAIMFDFELKFAFTSAPTLTVTFERKDSIVVYELKSQNDLQMWRSVLKLKINQRGFHEQFKAIKKIGKGNFASVYLVQKYEDKLKYAVKAFSKEAAYAEDKGKECLIKEIEIMRCLCHKNNMRLFEVFESVNSLYIVFELLEGGSLHDKIKSKYKFKPSDIQTIVYGILLGLREMSEKKIMHRDLKPENLLFREQNSMDCVIADFGLAQFSEADDYLFVRCGTPGYVAPEVINIKDMKTKYQPICDVFSLGLIFHLLLFGKSAFSGRNYDEVVSQNRACNIDLSGEQYKRHGQDAYDLLVKMLKKNPKERITAKEALKHPYFSDSHKEDIHEETVFQEKKDTYPSLDSPLLMTNNNQRKMLNKKDSCVEFKLGKENLLTGKTQTVGSVNGGKVSGMNFEGLKTPAVSKFAQKR